MNQIGWFYENGWAGLPEDYDKAAEYYTKSAEKGLRFSQYRLGLYYDVIKKNYSEALKWYDKAAEQNHAEALTSAGHLYQNGLGTRKDLKKAFEFYKSAAEKGLPMAQHNLGGMYERGDGVKKSKAKAIEWYKKAANNSGSWDGARETAQKDLKRLGAK